MNSRPFFLVLAGLLLGLVTSIQAEPKAYDLVKYHGKAGGATIVFDYADGYPEASDVKIITGGKTSTFHLDPNATGNAKFVSEKPGGPIKSVLLEMDINGPAPATVKGSYVTGEKTVSFTVTKGR